MFNSPIVLLYELPGVFSIQEIVVILSIIVFLAAVVLFISD